MCYCVYGMEMCVHVSVFLSVFCNSFMSWFFVDACIQMSGLHLAKDCLESSMAAWKLHFAFILLLLCRDGRRPAGPLAVPAYCCPCLHLPLSWPPLSFPVSCSWGEGTRERQMCERTPHTILIAHIITPVNTHKSHL